LKNRSNEIRSNEIRSNEIRSNEIRIRREPSVLHNLMNIDESIILRVASSNCMHAQIVLQSILSFIIFPVVTHFYVRIHVVFS
jgi:hypothetical protein